MKTRMRQQASFAAILGEDRALEFAVEEMPFIFWQYGGPEFCSDIPATSASDATVFGFLDDVVSVASYGDDDLLGFLPYYHQSATQLGYPISDESYLVGLMFPNQDTARAYVPAEIPVGPYDDGAAMRDVQSWIASSGSEIMLIYGQYDPWTAGAVDLGGATDSFKFVAPGGNHGSSIASLVDAEQTTAVDAVLRWAGRPSEKPGERVPAHEPTVERDEFLARRRR
jgi:hypothetical protein